MGTHDTNDVLRGPLAEKDWEPFHWVVSFVQKLEKVLTASS